MIPGKVFFQSIEISEHFNMKYEVYLLMNGIFYDKIKPFQSKYLCLTANDILQVELGLKNFQAGKQNDDVLAEIRPLNDKKIVQNALEVIKNLPSQYLKVLIPQAYKLVLQSKTIDIKFQLNSKNDNEQIKVHFSFEPVSSFSRKKLGATLTSNKTTVKNNTNFNATQQRLNLFQRRENNHQTFGQSSYANFPESYFPQKIDYVRGRSSRSKSPTSSQDGGLTEKQYDQKIGLSKTMDNRRGYFREKIIQQPNTLKEISQVRKTDRKFNYVPQDIIIEDDSLSSNKYFNSVKRPISPEKIQQPQQRYKIDAMKRIIDPLPHFNQGTNFQMLSEIMQNQTYTSRGNQLFQGSEQKITIEKSSQELIKSPGKTQNFQTEGNLRSFQSASQHDTLESLAYQREKILGQLFGKLGTRGKK